MEGYGVMNFHDGSIYTGGFRNDRPHGKGRMVGKDGNLVIGIWDNGKMISANKSNNGLSINGISSINGGISSNNNVRQSGNLQWEKLNSNIIE
jgi:hypothetical protein